MGLFLCLVLFTLICHLQFPVKMHMEVKARVIPIIQQWVFCLFCVGRIYVFYLCYLLLSLWVQIFVGGLDSSVTDEHLRHVFAPYGELVHVKIPVGKRCGFVQFSNRYMNFFFSGFYLFSELWSPVLYMSNCLYVVCLGRMLNKPCQAWMVHSLEDRISGCHGEGVHQTNRSELNVTFFIYIYIYMLLHICSHFICGWISRSRHSGVVLDTMGIHRVIRGMVMLSQPRIQICTMVGTLVIQITNSHNRWEKCIYYFTVKLHFFFKLENFEFKKYLLLNTKSLIYTLKKKFSLE